MREMREQSRQAKEADDTESESIRHDFEDVLRQAFGMREAADERRARHATLTPFGDNGEAYISIAVVAVIESIARARGKLDRELSDQLGEANRITRRVLMSLHEAGESRA